MSVNHGSDAPQHAGIPFPEVTDAERHGARSSENAHPVNSTQQFFISSARGESDAGITSAHETYEKCISVTKHLIALSLPIPDNTNSSANADHAIRTFADLIPEIEVAFAAVLKTSGLENELADWITSYTVRHIGKEIYWSRLMGVEIDMASTNVARVRNVKPILDDPICEKLKRRLTAYVGDWKSASPVELRLAKDLLDREDDLLTVRAALAGQIEAESCFR